MKKMWSMCGAVLFAYFMVDVNYYIRWVMIYLCGKYYRNRIKFTEPSTVYGMVLPTDADFAFTHMNNARYLREYDFARFDHATRTGVIAEMLKSGGGFFVAAHTIRYRQPVMMFSRYKVLTQPVWWDKKYIYYDHRIVTLSDGIIRSVGYTKSYLSFDVEEFVTAKHPGVDKPPMPEDMMKWLEHNKASSDKMKLQSDSEILSRMKKKVDKAL